MANFSELPLRVQQKILIDPSTGCWNWTAYCQPNGYGRLWDGTRQGMAHKVIYQWLVGLVPEGLQLDHLCRNRRCGNPDHLEPVTQKENILRGEGFSARAARATHCPQGHPYDDENTYWDNGGRKCKICISERHKTYYENNKDKWTTEDKKAAAREKMRARRAEYREQGLTSEGVPWKSKQKRYADKGVQRFLATDDLPELLDTSSAVPVD